MENLFFTEQRGGIGLCACVCVRARVCVPSTFTKMVLSHMFNGEYFSQQLDSGSKLLLVLNTGTSTFLILSLSISIHNHLFFIEIFCPCVYIRMFMIRNLWKKSSNVTWRLVEDGSLRRSWSFNNSMVAWSNLRKAMYYFRAFLSKTWSGRMPMQWMMELVSNSKPII